MKKAAQFTLFDLDPKAPKFISRPTFVNRHRDRATVKRVEAKAASIYPTGCFVVFGLAGVYLEPREDNTGNSMIVSYCCHNWIAVRSIEMKNSGLLTAAQLRDLIAQAEPVISEKIEYMNSLFSNPNLI